MIYMDDNGKVYKYTMVRGRYPIDIWNETAFIFCMLTYIKRFERDFLYIKWKKGTKYDSSLQISYIKECFNKYFPELKIKEHVNRTIYSGFVSKIKTELTLEIDKEIYNQNNYKANLKCFFKLVGII